jgi:hypothetical protein
MDQYPVDDLGRNATTAVLNVRNGGTVLDGNGDLDAPRVGRFVTAGGGRRYVLPAE